MAKIKLAENQECRLEFTHVDKQPASLYVAMNPMTGDWFQEHKHGEHGSAYYGTKGDALSLVNCIIEKSAKEGLPCKVTVQKRTVLGDL